MTNNALAIKRIATTAWLERLPVSFVLAECISLGHRRPFIRRYVKVLYETLDCEYEAFYWR